MWKIWTNCYPVVFHLHSRFVIFAVLRAASILADLSEIILKSGMWLVRFFNVWSQADGRATCEESGLSKLTHGISRVAAPDASPQPLSRRIAAGSFCGDCDANAGSPARLTQLQPTYHLSSHHEHRINQPNGPPSPRRQSPQPFQQIQPGWPFRWPQQIHATA